MGGIDSQEALETATWALNYLVSQLKWMTKDHKHAFLKFLRDLMASELKDERKGEQ